MNIYIANYDSSGMTAREESRYQHAAGRRLLKTALLRAGISMDVLSKEESLIFAYGASGKPFLRELPDVHFNISHTKGMVVCAVSQVPVGIDAEKIKPYPKSVLRKMTEKERSYIEESDSPDKAFMRVWTMKEAMIKLTGEGLAALTKTECVPGEVLCSDMAVSGGTSVSGEKTVCNSVSDFHCRQMIWQGQYVITAVENTNKNQDCIFSKKVYNRL